MTTIAPARLDAYRQAVYDNDVNLDAVVALLREYGTAAEDDLCQADYSDPTMKVKVALGTLQGSLQALALTLSQRFSVDVRRAPAAALADVVGDVMASCPGPGCYSRLAPWDIDHDGDHCSAECRNACMAEDGETWSDR